MNEKVLGLKESKIQELVNRHNCLLHRKDFVSVRLASESVTIKWLEKFCKEHEVKTGYGMMPFIHSFDLIKKAKKEAKKK